MSVCTFQPNFPRHAASSGGTSRVTGVRNSSRFEPPQDGGDSGGVSGGGGGGNRSGDGGGGGGTAADKKLDSEGDTADRDVTNEGEEGERKSGAPGNGLDDDERGTADTNVSGGGGEEAKRLSGATAVGSGVPSQEGRRRGRARSRNSVFPAETAVAQRLYNETKRLAERRFEAQERKRMGAEEVYARTCTFEVRAGTMVARMIRV